VDLPADLPREVKREARPDPNQPGWGRTISLFLGKAREGRGSQEWERAWPRGS